MNYSETIEYLYSRLPLFSRIGAAAIKKDLTNTTRICNLLDNPQKKFKSIHIAGTNGKGSVSHMLAAILQTAGYKTGLYTSPHLKDFRERIKVNGEMVSEEFVTSFTERIKPFIEEFRPSFFEITVAMAFEWFADLKVDIAIIETGLGGRLDSTNIITPEISVITNIGWDHMDLLGDSLEKIAAEKGGIIKPGVPVVLGEYAEETYPVLKKIAEENHSPLSVADKKRWVNNWYWEKHELVAEAGHEKYHLDLPGIYQRKNLLTVIETCHQLRTKGWNITDDAMRRGLKQVKKLTGIHGRWEIIHNNPMVVLDVAHNFEGISQLLQQLEVTPHNKLFFIIGMVRDKEIGKILSALPNTAEYFFTRAQIPRALPENELLLRAQQAGLKGKSFGDVNQALKGALAQAHPDDLVIVCGSVYLVGEVNKISPSFSNA